MKKQFTIASKASLVLVLLVILAGSLVRMTGSGMGCPDWPKCFGYFIPPTDVSQIEWKSNTNFKKGIIIKFEERLIFAKEDFKSGSYIDLNNWNDYTKHNYSDFDPVKTWIEFLNRLIGLVAGLATLSMLFLSISLWKKKKTIFFISLAIVLGMGFQAWLGKLVVDSNLAPYKITIHMLMALVIVSLLIYSIFLIKGNIYNIVVQNNSLKILIVFSVLISLIQITIGTQVREFVDIQYDSFGPEKKEMWLTNPNFYFYFHRSFSILIFLVNLILFYLAYRKKMYLGIIEKIMFIIFLEIVVGIAMYYGDFPLLSQPIHLILATLLFSYQFYWMLHIRRI